MRSRLLTPRSFGKGRGSSAGLKGTGLAVDTCRIAKKPVHLLNERRYARRTAQGIDLVLVYLSDVVFCFAKSKDAEAFAERFGGELFRAGR
jgi:hypothetical protein